MAPCSFFRKLIAAALLGTAFVGAGIAPAKAEVAPVATMHLMSGAQYRAAISQIFGPDIKVTARFPLLRRSDGLVAVGAGTALVTSGALEIFEESARTIAAQVVDEGHRNILVGCEPVDTMAADDACARAYFGAVGRLLFRRALSPEELETHVVLARTSAEAFGGFYPGIEYSLAGMLASPQFLYFTEQQEDDPKSPGALRLDGYSKASRLSLFLWNSIPDEPLLRAAESGALHTKQGLHHQVDRMLASSRAKEGVRAFFEDMLVLEKFADLTKDATIYPAFTQLVVGQAKEQTLRIIEDHLVTRNGDYRDLFTTRHVFLTSGLGALYRVPVQTASPLDWVAYEIPKDDPRAGILMQIGFLSAHAHPGRGSATRRGKALREIFMCQRVPDPPANVDFAGFEDPDHSLPTTRQRLASHSQNPVCAGCHKITDPTGLALENFDGAGLYRASEKGAAIDPSGSFEGRSFSNPEEMVRIVRDNPAISACLVQRLHQYAARAPVKSLDRDFVARLQKQFAADGYRILKLMKAMAGADEFYRVAIASP